MKSGLEERSILAVNEQPVSPRGRAHFFCVPLPQVAHYCAPPASGMVAVARPIASRMNAVTIVHFNVKR
jgi:hypothetical protein